MEDEDFMDLDYNEPFYNNPIKVMVAADLVDSLFDTDEQPIKRKDKRSMKTIKKAFDIGSARATNEFFKHAGALEAIVGAQSKDPRKTLALSLLGGTLLANVAHSGLTGTGITGEALNYLGVPAAQSIGTLAGLGALGTAAYMGSTSPGLLTPTTAEQRLSTEIAAKLQDPESLLKAIKGSAGLGAAALVAPVALYQLGKAMGRDESSIF